MELLALEPIKPDENGKTLEESKPWNSQPTHSLTVFERTIVGWPIKLRISSLVNEADKNPANWIHEDDSEQGRNNRSRKSHVTTSQSQ